MRISLFGLVASFLVGCTISAPMEAQQSGAVSTTAVPRTTGTFIGHYVVPSPADLTEAALFAMPEVEWTIASGVATLHYDLPLGLVGGDLSVSLSGPLPSGATSVQLSSTSGTGSCTAQATKITCTEQLANLGTLPISEAIVAQVAAAEYPGPVSDRTAIASSFSSDPIGTVDFDISLPSPDDDGGGGHGGGGGGHGGHGPH